MDSPIKKNRSLELKQQNIRVTYDQSLETRIHAVYGRMCTQYTAVTINYITETNTLEVPPTFLTSRKSLLTKRPAKVIYLQRFIKEEELAVDKAKFAAWLHYCDGGCCMQELEDTFPTMEVVKVADKEDEGEIYAKSTKLMRLDFIWLGVGGRLGVGVADFVMSVAEYQNFQEYKVSYIDQFLQAFNSSLDPMTTSQTPEQSLLQISETLEQCKYEVEQKLPQIEQQIQNLIIESFSDHMLISTPTYHTYYKLLTTRNYFKMIWLEEPAIKRYRNFLNTVQTRFEQIYKWIANKIENFLILDDYCFQNFLQKCSYEAHFVINAGVGKTIGASYRGLIARNYKEIFRKFRPDFDEYFISLCKILKMVGSIIVKNKRILSTGYNGTPIGAINCYNGGCRICNDSNKINTAVLSCNCIHAEYSAIMQAGIESTVGCTLYTTQLPCLWCAKVISQAKISMVVYLKSESKLLEYDNQERVYEIFRQANVQLVQYTDRERRFSKFDLE